MSCGVMSEKPRSRSNSGSLRQRSTLRDGAEGAVSGLTESSFIFVIWINKRG